MLRLLEALYMIKALWVDCPMPLTSFATQNLADALGLSPKQIGRIIPELQAHDLIRTNGNRGHEAISWHDLCKRFDIPHQSFYYIPYQPIGKKGHRLRLWHILYAKLKKEKKDKCANAYHMRVKHNPVIKQVLNEVAGNAYNAKAVAYHQFRCFVTEGALYDNDERYVLNMAFASKDDKILNADFEMNYNTWSKAHGYKSRGALAKMDRKAEALGLITITHRKTQIPGHTTRGARRGNRQGFVQYDAAHNQLWLIKCDARQVLPLKGLTERLEANQLVMDKAKAGRQAALNELQLHKVPYTPGKHSAWVRKSWLTRKSADYLITKMQANEQKAA